MIHPTAIIDSRAKLAPDVEVGPFVVIEGPVVIASGCHIYQSVYITGSVEIGENTIIHPFVTIGHFPQDFSFNSSIQSKVRIGPNCELREGVTVHRGSTPESCTQIGAGCYLMAYSHVAHNCEVGDGVTMANCAILGGFVEVGDFAFVSGNVSVHQHARIGSLAMVSSSSFINKDLPPFCVAQGVPAHVAAVNVVGLRRNGYGQQARNEVKDLFKILYRSNYNVSQAVEQLQRKSSQAASVMVDFIAGSRRGLSGYAKRRRG